eukprot:12925006-Alexandrium_andersonii.AAC.1
MNKRTPEQSTSTCVPQYVLARRSLGPRKTSNALARLALFGVWRPKQRHGQRVQDEDRQNNQHVPEQQASTGPSVG